MGDRVILHCDLNCFFASVELLSHPDLRDIPTAVCGDPASRHGIILAKNEPAKRLGIQTAETIWQAKKKCPGLVLLPPHHGLYREYSRRVNAIYEQYTDLVEPFGIDESWLDVSGTLHLFGGDPTALADEIRRRMRQEFGLTISVGVSFNKVFAKLGSDYKKPDATTCITRENFRQMVWPLPVGDLLYVGRAAAETMKKFGVRTIGDLARFDRESLFHLLTEGLSALSELGEVMLSDRLRQISVRPAPKLSVHATVKSNLLDVELGASGLSAADLAIYLDSYKRHQTFARLTSGDIIRLDEGARAAFGLAENLGVDAVDLLDGVSLPASSTLFVDSMLARTPALEADRDAAFRRTVERLDTLGKMDFTVPASLKATLRGYQVDGYQWLGSLEHLGLGGILADDMGLGKTLQMIAHILARVEAGDTKPTLVVCPASLVYNWTAELERFAPSLDVCAIVGAKAQRRVQIAGVAEHNVVVTSYDLMRRDIDEYAGQDFARVVLDEAQYIKNPLTQVARAAKRLPAGVRFALTGTPIENRLSELWSIFDFLMPGLLGTRESFAKRFESPVEHAEGDSAARLQALVSPFVLRRVKEDVVADLPEKIEDTVMAQLTGEQRKLYLANQDRIAQQVQHREASEFKKDKLKVLAELTKLRQICCDPRLHYEDYKAGSAKLDTCMELVHGALDGGHRILLFSQFTGMLDIIGKRLAKEDIAFLKLTGASSKESRAKMVAQFQAGEVPVFLISLKAGGVGLNLTAADVVIHYDPWWNVAAHDQATDRAHRIGQQHTVTVYKLIAKDTIEERIMQMQESKRDLVNSVLGGDGISSALFTREDVLALLGGDGR